ARSPSPAGPPEDAANSPPLTRTNPRSAKNPRRRDRENRGVALGRVGVSMAEPQSAKPALKLTAICPQFIVPDVVAAAEYYRDILGFKILGYFLDPPVFAMVARDAAEIHFGKPDAGAPASPNITRRKIATDAYIWVTDLDALHAELKQRGAKIIEG